MVCGSKASFGGPGFGGSRVQELDGSSPTLDGFVVDEVKGALALGVLANEELVVMALGVVEAWFSQGGNNRFWNGFLKTGCPKGALCNSAFPPCVLHKNRGLCHSRSARCCVKGPRV